jgi:hypothetical protein
LPKESDDEDEEEEEELEEEEEDPEEGEEEWEEGPYAGYGIEELARFPLKGRMKTKEVAERIALRLEKFMNSKRQLLRGVNATKERHKLTKRSPSSSHTKPF